MFHLHSKLRDAHGRRYRRDDGNRKTRANQHIFRGILLPNFLLRDNKRNIPERRIWLDPRHFHSAPNRARVERFAYERLLLCLWDFQARILQGQHKIRLPPQNTS